MKTEKVKLVHQKARFLIGLMALSMLAYFAARFFVDLNT
jgi:hypothetical protein